MKRNSVVLLIAFFLATAITVQAQDKIGIRAGYQSSAFYKDGSQLTGTDPYSSFYVGLFKDNKIIPAVHIGIGLEYMQTGKKVDDNNKQVLSYLSVPVYGKVKIGPFFGLGGIAANFKVSEKVFVNGNSAKPTDEQESKSVDFPLFLGAGFKISIFTLEARYHWGLTDINNGASSHYLQLGGAVSF